MTIAFLAALLDPVVLAAAGIGVFFARSAMQLRIGVMSVAAAMSLSELIGGMEDPLPTVAANAAGAAAGGLLLAEAARLVIAPVAAGVLGVALRALSWLQRK
jgi:hypothetical protein